MELIPVYSAYIESELRKIDFPETPNRLYDPLRYFLQIGGKRMRPILTLLSGELFGLQKEQVINAALAIEVFHNFTLIHDDIMDEAPVRRGFETVHTKWDSSTAILSGDVLMIQAYQLLEKQDGDLRALLKVFNQTAVEICEGQQIDMDFETRTDVEIEDYIEMIKLKTSVLLGCALELSAIIANTSVENRKHIYNFGVNIGLAFQIKDDVLDLYGDPSKFGKQVGGDVIANKKTILYLLAQKNADDNQLHKLKALIAEKDVQKKLNETKSIYDEIGVLETANEWMNHYFSLAQDDLKQIDVSDERKLVLKQLGDFLLKREH
jgi:geranylgeranyl diphosphate synthase type II